VRTAIWALFCLLSLTSICYAQGIDQLRLVDGDSLPLIEDDDGVKFEYRTTSSGELSAYLRTSSRDVRIFLNRQEFRGIGNIILSSSALFSFASAAGFVNSDVTMLLTHISSRTNHYSEGRLPLKMDIDAPYGYTLKDYPEKPNLFRTDLTKQITRPLAFAVFVVGCGLLLAGSAFEIDIQYSEGEIFQVEETSAHALLAIGISAAILGYEYLYERVSDDEKNAQNARFNKELLRRWRQEHDHVQRQNELTRATFTIRFSLR